MLRSKLLNKLVVVALTSVVCTGVVNAETPEEKGLAIAKEMKSRDLGWGDSQTSLTMVLKNASGQTSQREICTKTLEVDNDGDKGLNIFDHPRDVKGTAFLSFSHPV